MTLLLVCLVSAAFMAGLSCFVGAVHYPLFAAVGAGGWPEYHRRHSRRTTFVVLPPMAAELVTAAWIVVDRPDGVGATPAAAGLVLAAGTWALTAAASARHSRLAGRLDPPGLRSLLTVHHARTALWSGHALLAAAMLASAA